MRAITHYFSVAAGLFALTAGCASTASRLSPSSNVETSVIVRNNNFSDMNIYVVSAGGVSTRLGFVPGQRSARLKLPAWTITTGSVRIAADPIGSTAVVSSEPLSVMEGDVITFSIEQNVALSMATVRASAMAR